jgi:hypothetical protein
MLTLSDIFGLSPEVLGKGGKTPEKTIQQKLLVLVPVEDPVEG